MVFLGKSLGLASQEMGIAKTAALLHDIGRFIQYERYSTFSDPSSENHAALGVQVIQEQDPVAAYPDIEKTRIIKAISLHNAHHLPRGMDNETLMLTRLLRDADKLDIFGVMTKKYLGTDQFGTDQLGTDQLGTDQEENSYITLNLKDDGQVSEDLMTDILKKESIDSRKIRSLNDLKLLHISWVFDLNFREAVKRVDELEFIPLIVSTMPDSKSLASLLDFVKTYMKDNSIV